MKPGLLVDTDILIDVSHGNEAAISLDIPLATRNLVDFWFIPELRLETCGEHM